MSLSSLICVVGIKFEFGTLHSVWIGMGASRDPPEADSPACFVLPAREPSTFRVPGLPAGMGCFRCAADLGYRDDEAVADPKEFERCSFGKRA